MQPLAGASDLTAPIAEVRAVGAALAELRMQVIEAGRRGAEIAADTRWKSQAMSGYERAAGEWQRAVADLAVELTGAGDAVDRIVDELVLTELLRSAAPGMVVAR
ncbi:hypothetical protein LK09_17365 [Microbacterium mangrovi]|uniref:Uncharacterized protein n=1 Tax=Microbacterium mangrovi TaxID=1348253 RepID=A0A0B1ZYJ6_9MICO|nr:hypothetical protein [Microbacterium mangrovi]KHK95806.1 hypothetical protein LK09_17365 [Microbacterium mangrovi]